MITETNRQHNAIEAFTASCPLVHDASLLDKPGIIDAATGNLQYAFSPAVLVSIPRGQAVLDHEGWKKLTFDETQNTPYERQLWSADIGVVCGSTSLNLCAIHFSDWDSVLQFTKANPVLENSLITGNSERITIWLRLTDYYPPNMDLRCCRWVSDGLIPVYRRDSITSNDRFINFCRPAALEFRSIKWDPEDQAVLQPLLIAHKWGNWKQADRKGRATLNPNFWAEYFLAVNPCRFTPALGRFQVPGQAQGSWKLTYDNTIVVRIQEFLLSKVRPGYPLHEYCNAVQLREIMRALRRIAPNAELVTETEALETFVTQCLERHEGSDLTVAEIFYEYSAYCGRTALPVMLEAEFQLVLPEVLLKLLRLRKSKSIPRDGKDKRGYRNLRLKPTS